LRSFEIGVHRGLKKNKRKKSVLMLLKEVSYAHQGYFYLIKNTVKTYVVKLF